MKLTDAIYSPAILSVVAFSTLAFIQPLFGSLLAGVFTLFAAFVYFLPALNSFVGAARAWTAAY